MDPKKVLWIGDGLFWREFLERSLGDAAIFLVGFSYGLAERLFEQNPNVTVIIADGFQHVSALVLAPLPNVRLDDARYDLIPLIDKIRKTYGGTIIATPSAVVGNPDLMQAGRCDYQCGEGELLATLARYM